MEPLLNVLPTAKKLGDNEEG